MTTKDMYIGVALVNSAIWGASGHGTISAIPASIWAGLAIILIFRK